MQVKKVLITSILLFGLFALKNKAIALNAQEEEASISVEEVVSIEEESVVEEASSVVEYQQVYVKDFEGVHYEFGIIDDENLHVFADDGNGNVIDNDIKYLKVGNLIVFGNDEQQFGIKINDDNSIDLIDMSAITENIPEEVKEDLKGKTNAAIAFEDNVLWIFGIPIGTLVSAIGFAVFAYKKLKKFAASIKEDKKLNDITREDIVKAMDVASQKLKEAEEYVNQSKAVMDTFNALGVDLLDSQRLANQSMVIATDKVQEVLNKYDEGQAKIDDLTRKIEVLEKQVGIIANQSADLVKSGISEEVNKLIEGE